MNPRFLALGSLILGLSLILAGCAKTPPASPANSSSCPHSDKVQATKSTPSPHKGTTTAPTPREPVTPAIDPDAVCNSKRNRATCYHLQPAKKVATTKAIRQGPKSKKALKKSAKNAAIAKRTKSRKVVYRTVGICQPQSLIYARCRTGITTCQLGNTSPVQWSACARRNQAITSTPVAGSVIVLDANARRNMPTGHPAYVESAHLNPDGTWRLRISHTNYDRQCHLDLDANVTFFPRTMTASFESGPWAPWAKRMQVLGFIIR